MPKLNEKQWHIWRATCGERAVDVVACGGQQARKVAAAFWMVRYAEVGAVCVSRVLSRGEGYGPRLAPEGLAERFVREAPPPLYRPRLVRVDKPGAMR
jgi:hypothetical protein